MKWNKTFITLTVFFPVFLIIFACSSSKPPVTPFQESPPPPLHLAGVDSSTAAEADSLAKQLFVSWQRQETAATIAAAGEEEMNTSDSLAQLLSAINKDEKVSEKDSILAIQTYNQGARQLLAVKDVSSSTTLTEDMIRSLIQVHLDSAEFYFEKALRLNPFDRKTRFWLAKVYQMQANQLLKNEQLPKAAKALEKLLLMDRSQHELFARLGQIYMQLHQWNKALNAFRIAEETLQKNAVFNVPEHLPINDSTIAMVIDSSKLYLYLYYQGECNIHLYRAEEALDAFRRAQQFATSSEEADIARETMDWINWDEGNIHAVEFRDSMLTLIDRGEYEEAAKGFFALKKLLTTQKARDEIDWRLAMLEYTHLQKEDSALERLKKVTDSYLNGERQITPEDTLFQQFYNTYGAMCHNEGVKSLKQHKLREALAYFRQSISIPWNQRAKSYMELAKLSLNNPRYAVDAAQAALNERDQLTPDEQIATMRILIESLKRMGRFDEAIRYFKEYREYLTLVKGNE